MSLGEFLSFLDYIKQCFVLFFSPVYLGEERAALEGTNPSPLNVSRCLTVSNQRGLAFTYQPHLKKYLLWVI